MKRLRGLFQGLAKLACPLRANPSRESRRRPWLICSGLPRSLASLRPPGAGSPRRRRSDEQQVRRSASLNDGLLPAWEPFDNFVRLPNHCSARPARTEERHGSEYGCDAARLVDWPVYPRGSKYAYRMGGAANSAFTAFRRSLCHRRTCLTFELVVASLNPALA